MPGVKFIAIILVVIVASFVYICTVYKIVLDDKINLSDIYSNILNIVILLLTLFVIQKITDEQNKIDRSKAFEKDLFIERVSRINQSSDQLLNIVESGSSQYETISDLIQKIKRSFRIVNNHFRGNNSSLSEGVDSVTEYCAQIDDILDKLEEILTNTPIKSNSIIPQQTFISINEGFIIINDSGKMAAKLEIERIVDLCMKLSLAINRSE